MVRIPKLLCVLVFGCFVLVPPQALSQEETEGYEQELRAAGLGIDRPSLLKFLERRSSVSIDATELKRLLQDLSSEKYSERQSAFRAFVAFGALSRPALNEVLSDPDAGRERKMARKCLQVLNDESEQALTLTTARLLAARQAEEAIPLLLSFLPKVQSEEAREGLVNTILDLSNQQEQLPKAILDALKDPLHLRRALAIDAIRGRDVSIHRGLLLQAMNDKSPIVRLKAAQGIRNLHDEKAILAFARLITELPIEYAQQAEDELFQIAGEQAPATTLTDTDTSRKSTRQIWEKWWNDQKSEKLIRELVRRTLTEEKHKEASALLIKLGDDSYDVREAAQKDLVSMGPSIAPLLRQHSDSEDPEVRQRARECLVSVDKESGGPLSPDVPRLLAFSKSKGGVKAMFDYLPFVENEEVREAIMQAVRSLAIVDGSPNTELVKGLESKDANVRAASIHALCQPGQDEMIQRAKKMLSDPEQIVRMRASLALAKVRERTAVPVLINSIAFLKISESEAAQDYLLGLNDFKAPAGAEVANPKARSEAWSRWWKENGEKVRLVTARRIRRTRPSLGYLLVSSPYTSEVFELDRNGKRRWTVRGVSSPRDVAVLSANRILVLETGTRKLTERDLQGKVHNTFAIPNTLYPVELHVLRNGNRLIAGYNQVIEVTKSGKTVWTFNRPENDIRSVRRLKNGQTIMMTSRGQALRVSRTGKIMKTWSVLSISYVLGYEILPNGNILIPNKYGHRVEEYDQKGKRVWTAQVQRPESVTRLPNGTTVVGSGQSPYSLVYFDRNGKQIKKVASNVRAMHLNNR